MTSDVGKGVSDVGKEVMSQVRELTRDVQVQATHTLCQGLIDPRSGERACNSAYACRDGGY